MKIAVLEPLGIPEAEVRAIAKPIIDKGHELIIYKDKRAEAEVLKERVKDMDVLVLANMPLKGEIILSNEKIKMISVAFTGVDHVNLKVCKENNIIVSNSAGYSTPSVAELTYGLIISLLRNIVPLDKATREGKTMAGFTQIDLSGKTLGVIGTGAIGQRVAEIGLAFGCRVLAYNRSENESLIKQGVTYMSLEELLKESHILTIHLPLTDNTRGLIDKDKIKLMKKDALLINTARGPIVDNQALAEALKNGEIAGAGIDVFDMEPPLPSDYPLLNSPNTVLAPHIGFATKEAMKRRAEITFDNILRWLEGSPQNRVI
ncbi:D-3-phosphoglycerate dehydrogenase [Proteiniborus ethanoligenes]|uniref:D-3-phosphoglycerate dehydrogenase n=1 Tax=Proteiniborus ethanoligenes TaxID=415015 RepID=A0A1H3MPZ6_9FIRM|nr:2-hydroxyacid dehydrogenase [Proteiniborus ethanoligenes]SDY78564.1 D-3-phosphoglycerate dehydrogenase [Proteiniborus ethanoligenes]